MMTGKQLRKTILVGFAIASFICAICIPSLSQVVSSPNPGSQSQEQALNLALQGQAHYRRQDFRQAAQSWEQAATVYAALGDREGVEKSLINQSQALQDLGLYPKACRTLLRAFDADKQGCDEDAVTSLVASLAKQEVLSPEVHAVGLRSLGDVLRRQGLLAPSKQVLELSLKIAEDAPAAPAINLSLGNTERAEGARTRNQWDYEQVTDIINRQSAVIALETAQPALDSYQKASQGNETITQVQAQLNQLSLWLDMSDWWGHRIQQRLDSWERLEQYRFIDRATNFSNQLQTLVNQQGQDLQAQIESALPLLAPGRATVFAHLNYARSLMRWRQISGNDIPQFEHIDDHIESALQIALEQAQATQDIQAESYALGYQGQFYGMNKQVGQATQLTQQALSRSSQLQSANALEVNYLWQAQLGRLLNEQGDRQGAIEAYTNAYQSLQSLRADLNTRNQEIQLDFQQDVKPVYIALADLLLQTNQDSTLAISPQVRADIFPLFSSAAGVQDRVELARQVIESLQLAELDNFFQDPCSDVPDIPVQIDDIDPDAAVIYPIVFKDRLDLILSIPNQPLHQISVDVAKEDVDRTLDQLYDLLNNESIDTSAINIFRTVPLNAQEVSTNLQQLLPIFSELYDWLIRPLEQELTTHQVKTLVFVLNDRLQRVPLSALFDGNRYLIEQYNVALAPSLQLVNAGRDQQKRPSVLVAGVSEQSKVGNYSFPALVNVPAELSQIQRIFPRSRQLLDRRFTEQSLKRNLNRNYSIIHLATHGLFSSNPENNFIVTGDQQSISIEELSLLLKGQRSRAPQLLVLSACETATGDEQAVLGLAGMAVRSGTSSTLATLWPVGDASTAQFMGQFYQALSQPHTPKSEALKSAQRSLLKKLKAQPPFQELEGLPPHPYYWAPYVLVGSWL